MTVLREPSADEERQIATRAAHLKALLDAAREVGLSGHPEYGWDLERPAEPRLVIAGVPIRAVGIEDVDYLIGENRRVSATRLDLALRAIRAPASTTKSRTGQYE